MSRPFDDSFAWRGKFGGDVLWSVGGLALVGLSGVVLNILIGRFYDPAALGVFNQVFAVYILFSQIGVFGIHLSVLKYVAQLAEDPAQRDTSLTAGLILAGLVSLAATSVCWLLSGWVGRWLGSPQVGQGLLWMLPGLFFFSVNKVLLAVLNGLRRMKAFALAQALRVFFMIGALVICLVLGAPAHRLPVLLSAAEGGLFILLLIYLPRCCGLRLSGGLWHWGEIHLRFGLKGFLSGTLAEMNTRVDVIMLGFFMGDAQVGIYSVAALPAEGLAQLAVVMRNNYNPLLARFISQDRREELAAMVKKGKKAFFLTMLGVGALALALYPLYLWLVGKPEFSASWLPFALLVGGLVAASPWLPFDMILVQGGLPGSHTLLRLFGVLSNILLNLILIPLWGLAGGALATGTSFVLLTFYLRAMSRSRLDIRL